VKRRMHVLSLTHWDREHRQGFQVSRLLRADVLDQVIDAMERNANYRYSIMDGQCAPIDDYLAPRPHRREQVARPVREGRLRIGPRYTLVDAFAYVGCQRKVTRLDPYPAAGRLDSGT